MASSNSACKSDSTLKLTLPCDLRPYGTCSVTRADCRGRTPRGLQPRGNPVQVTLMRLSDLRPSIARVLPLAFLAGACASPAPASPVTPCPAPPVPVAAAPVASAQVAATPRAPDAVVGPAPITCPKGMQVAPDGLFDDFEDGTNQVALVGGRNGYWWVAKAEHAGIEIPGPEFRAVDGGPKGSKKAAHFAGHTDAQDVWGASLGGNFLGGSFYDASKYAGVSFELKGKAKSFLRFKLHDVNTHPDGSICSKDS